VDDFPESTHSWACQGCGSPNSLEARFCSACGEPLLYGSVAGVPVADPLLGRVIADRYRILSMVGRGGMGVVYQVEHVQIGKIMAMKLLHGELARHRDVLKRFRREAEAASKLSHPNTVQIFDFGQAERLAYLVMEYVEGGDLGQLLKREGPLDFARAARICAQVCASVAEAHEHGIVHRDVKPENIMVSQTRGHPDFVKVLDFGLAKLREGTEQPSLTLTRAGNIVGTPYYMAPEQIRGDEVDPRTDVYGLGAVLYKAITGEPPFRAGTPMGVLTKHLTEAPVPPSQRGAVSLPPQADAIVMRALQKDPAARHPTASDLREELLAYLRSVGEGSGMTLMGSPAAAGAIEGAGKSGPVATRSDVDAYQRRLKRRGWVGYVILLLLSAGVAGAGWWYWTDPAMGKVSTVEMEPNNTPQEANSLPAGQTIKGYLARRISREMGDVDVFRIDTPDGERRIISVLVTAIPNMDLVVDVAQQGRSVPLLEAKGGGVGQPVHIPNFPIEGPVHYLRVRQRWVEGQLPTENVSDAYTIRWETVAAGPDDEREVNDALELANPIGAGERRRGFIGWAGDVDYYCLSADAASVVAKVSGVEDVDLVLRVVDRDKGRSRTVDDGGPGEGERSPVVAGARAEQTCFGLSVAHRSPRPANPSSPYVLEVLEAQ
jgi:eukaryotic-like serine/threonine-protein kinase